MPYSTFYKSVSKLPTVDRNQVLLSITKLQTTCCANTVLFSGDGTVSCPGADILERQLVNDVKADDVESLLLSMSMSKRIESLSKDRRKDDVKQVV